MSSFNGVNLSSSALAAARRALDVIGQNVANASNPAYSRQRVIWSSNEPNSGVGPQTATGAFHLGNGVQIEQVHRLHAAFLDGQMADLLGQDGQAALQGRVASQIEAVLAEPGDLGIQDRLARFFSAFDALASDPSNSALRQQVVFAGQSLAEAINSAVSRLESVRDETAAQTGALVDQVNARTREIADLTHRIRQAAGLEHQPNDLLDRRDALIDEVARLTGAKVTGRGGADLVISIDGHAVVQGDVQVDLAFDPQEPSVVIRAADSGDALRLRSGVLRGIQLAVDQTLPTVQQAILTLRDTLAAAVNTQHRAGVDALGAAGGDLLVVIGGALQVNPAVAADARLVAAGATDASGDGENAIALAGLRGVVIHNGSTTEQLFQRLVADVGRLARDAADTVDRASALLAQTRQLQADQQGVDLDQELVEMIHVQHVYAANARMLTAFDEMLGILIEQTGVVGR